MSVMDLLNVCLHGAQHDLHDLRVSVHEVAWQASIRTYRHAC